MRKLEMLTVSLCVVSTPFTVAAQTSPALLSIARVQVKPDRVGEFKPTPAPRSRITV
jgi:hypothetical protein